MIRPKSCNTGFRSAPSIGVKGMNRSKGLLVKIQKQRKQAELKKRQAAEQRAKDLNHAKWLVEEGGIDNINKAIGIFQKYEK